MIRVICAAGVLRGFITVVRGIGADGGDWSAAAVGAGVESAFSCLGDGCLTEA
jgi:hypothetical protein